MREKEILATWSLERNQTHLQNYILVKIDIMIIPIRLDGVQLLTTRTIYAIRIQI